MSRKHRRLGGFSRRLVLEFRSRPKVTKIVEEIKQETGTTMTVEDLRDRGYWNAMREGKPYYVAHTKAGLSLEIHCDARGKVIAVTYRLADTLVGALAPQAGW